MLSNPDRLKKSLKGSSRIISRSSSATKPKEPIEFGVALDRTQRTIPKVFRQCVEYLRITGLAQEGLFRKSGNYTQIEMYKDKFCRGEPVNLYEIKDIHTVAGLLKRYFRDMPEPLCTFELYDMFVSIMGIPKDLRKDKVAQVLDMLPDSHKVVLKYLISFLVEVVQYSDVNKMTPVNIAIVFSPNILRANKGMDSKEDIIKDSGRSNELVRTLVSQYATLFKDFPDPEEMPPVPIYPNLNAKASPKISKIKSGGGGGGSGRGKFTPFPGVRFVDMSSPTGGIASQPAVDVSHNDTNDDTLSDVPVKYIGTIDVGLLRSAIAVGDRRKSPPTSPTSRRLTAFVHTAGYKANAGPAATQIARASAYVPSKDTRRHPPLRTGVQRGRRISPGRGNGRIIGEGGKMKEASSTIRSRTPEVSPRAKSSFHMSSSAISTIRGGGGERPVLRVDHKGPPPQPPKSPKVTKDESLTPPPPPPSIRTIEKEKENENEKGDTTAPLRLLREEEITPPPPPSIRGSTDHNECTLEPSMRGKGTLPPPPPSIRGESIESKPPRPSGPKPLKKVLDTQEGAPKPPKKVPHSAIRASNGNRVTTIVHNNNNDNNNNNKERGDINTPHVREKVDASPHKGRSGRGREGSGIRGGIQRGNSGIGRRGRGRGRGGKHKRPHYTKPLPEPKIKSKRTSERKEESKRKGTLENKIVSDIMENSSNNNRGKGGSSNDGESRKDKALDWTERLPTSNVADNKPTHLKGLSRRTRLPPRAKASLDRRMRPRTTYTQPSPSYSSKSTEEGGRGGERGGRGGIRKKTSNIGKRHPITSNTVTAHKKTGDIKRINKRQDAKGGNGVVHPSKDSIEDRKEGTKQISIASRGIAEEHTPIKGKRGMSTVIFGIQKDTPMPQKTHHVKDISQHITGEGEGRREKSTRKPRSKTAPIPYQPAAVGRTYRGYGTPDGKHAETGIPTLAQRMQHLKGL